MNSQIYKVIGLMSGTSLDGLDIAYCILKNRNEKWSFSIEKAQTLRYPSHWVRDISNAHNLSGNELLRLDAAYGKFLGKTCASFILKHKLKVHFIASHGHTIFHQPKLGFTFQLGNGNALQANCGLPVIYDFRSLDVANGGEGAPLVPVGDKFLFSEYDVCLNLGGIANLSVDIKGKRTAFDICFANMGINYLASKKGLDFDNRGDISSTGEINLKMLKELNQVYKKFRTKRPSLGREIFEQHIMPILDQDKISVEDRLRTFTESTADEIAHAILSAKNNGSVLCTGGGAFNSFLISTLLEKCGDSATLLIPDDDVVKFKEALVFAFLGVLRVQGKVNCLKSVTGAKSDSRSGVMIGFR